MTLTEQRDEARAALKKLRDAVIHRDMVVASVDTENVSYAVSSLSAAIGKANEVLETPVQAEAVAT